MRRLLAGDCRLEKPRIDLRQHLAGGDSVVEIHEDVLNRPRNEGTHLYALHGPHAAGGVDGEFDVSAPHCRAQYLLAPAAELPAWKTLYPAAPTAAVIAVEKRKKMMRFIILPSLSVMCRRRRMV